MYHPYSKFTHSKALCFWLGLSGTTLHPIVCGQLDTPKAFPKAAGSSLEPATAMVLLRVRGATSMETLETLGPL